jgi:hypothetical protein
MHATIANIIPLAPLCGYDDYNVAINNQGRLVDHSIGATASPGSIVELSAADAARNSIIYECRFLRLLTIIVPLSLTLFSPSLCFAQTTALGVQCVATLNTGAFLVVRMKKYTQDGCQKAATMCLRGRPAKDIKYFDQAMALTLPTPLGLSSFPEVCDSDQVPLPASSEQPASKPVATTAAPSRPATTGSAQSLPLPNIEAVVDRLERFAFRDGQDSVQGRDSKRNISYNFLGYIGGSSGFSDLFFNTGHLTNLSMPGNVLLPTNDPLHSDIVAIMTDGSTPRVGPLAKNGQQALLRLLGIEPGPEVEWREQAVFDGACFLTHVYRNGRAERTVAWISLPHTGMWVLNRPGPGNSVVPAACLAAGIASHLGMQNVASLEPDEIIQTAEDGSGRLVVRFEFIDAINNLYGAGIADGMSRSEFKRRLVDFLTVKRQNLLERKNVR